MIIGNFEYDTDKDTYLGDIVTLNFSLESIAFVPNKKSGDAEPDYRVTAPTSIGHVELGAAWKRTSEKGQEFVSASLDSPLLAQPVNAAMFLEGDTATLVWSRRKAKDESKAESKKKAA